MRTKRVLVYAAVFALALVVIIGINISSTDQETSEGELVELIEVETKGDVEEVEAATTAKRIESYIQESLLETPANVSFALIDLTNQEAVRINNNQTYVTASLYKLFVAYYSYDQIDKGSVSLNTVVEGQSLENCLEKMITISDNTCGVALGDYFGWTNITNFVQNNGFIDTVIIRTDTPGSEFITSPNDIESFFIRLYKHELISDLSTDAFIGNLLNQEINNRLPVVIPEDLNIAHKTGDVYDYIHDAGIIFTPDGDYVYVIMSSDWAENMTFGPGYEYFKVIYDSIFNNIFSPQQ